MADGTVLGSPVYLLTTVAGLAITALLWRRLMSSEGRTPDDRLYVVYAAALAGAFAGAKLAFLLAEGARYSNDWLALLTGHSVTGALLGGVAGVEISKRMLGIKEGTGDMFAVTAPLAFALGRIGCIFAGCCSGVECAPAWWTVTDEHGHTRWPAPQVELLFNLAFWAWALLAWRFGWQRNQRFNIYLMAYGAFRFAHEFMRDDARWFGSFGGYHVVAMAIFAVGAWMYALRHRRLAAA